MKTENKPALPADELSILRRRVRAQRRELKRFNREVSGPKATYWWGFRNGLEAHAETILRGKMHKAFGYKAVWEAEHGGPCPESEPCTSTTENKDISCNT